MITSKDSIPFRYRMASLRDFSGIEEVIEWASHPFDSLFIHGTCGNGKTHLLYALVRELHKGYRCDVVSAVDINMRLRATFGNDSEEKEQSIIREYTRGKLTEIKDYSDCWDYLPMFDDLGAHKVSDYAREVWYEIIDKRYRNIMPAVYTSNLRLNEIAEVMGDRIASRLAGGVVFELKGDDRRVAKK